MPTQPPFIPCPWGAEREDMTSIPQSTTESGRASWEQGFPAENGKPLSQGGVPPAYADVQAALNALSKTSFFAQSGSLYQWSNTLDYNVSSIVVGSDGKAYIAKAASGVSTTTVNPVGDTSGTWQLIGYEFEGAQAQKSGSSGYVPAPAIGEVAQVLRSSGVWDTIANILGYVPANADEYLPLSGGTMTGRISTPLLAIADAADDTICGGVGIVGTQEIRIFSGSGLPSSLAGAFLDLFPQKSDGSFRLYANDGTALSALVGSANGTLLWAGKSVETVDSSGTNWIRYTSGIQICWITAQMTNSGYTWTFPKPFNGTKTVVACPDYSGSATGSTVTNIVSWVGLTTNTSVKIYSNTASSTATYKDVIAVGFWK